MIEVQVRQQNRVDLLRLVAGGLHVGRELACGGADALPCAGVDQNQLCAGVDQKGIERRLHARGFNRTACEQRANLALAHALQQLRRQIVVTVEQRGDFVIAQRQAEIPRRLSAHLRCLRHRAGHCQHDRQGRCSFHQAFHCIPL